VANNRLETERLDLVEIGNTDLASHRIFAVNLSDIHIQILRRMNGAAPGPQEKRNPLIAPAPL
jgi:hypothetical protein